MHGFQTDSKTSTLLCLQNNTDNSFDVLMFFSQRPVTEETDPELYSVGVRKAMNSSSREKNGLSLRSSADPKNEYQIGKLSQHWCSMRKCQPWSRLKYVPLIRPKNTVRSVRGLWTYFLCVLFYLIIVRTMLIRRLRKTRTTSKNCKTGCELEKKRALQTIQ